MMIDNFQDSAIKIAWTLNEYEDDMFQINILKFRKLHESLLELQV